MVRGALDPTDKHIGSRLRMRRRMLDLSQADLGNALGITFQQVQKYEKGVNRISASRLQHMSQILKVPVPFFFEGAPVEAGIALAARGTADAATPAYVSDFLATSKGLELVKAFMCIKERKLRRAIVQLVEAIAELREGKPTRATPSAVSRKSAVKSTVDLAPQFSNGALYGTITEIKGSQLVVTTKTGRSVQVDASAAVASKMSVPLFVGEHVAVTGTAGGAGEVKAEAIARAKPSPSSWPGN